MTYQLNYYNFSIYTIFQNVVFDIAAKNALSAIAISKMALELDYSLSQYN